MFIELSGTDELFTVLLVSAAGRLETTRLAKLLKLFLSVAGMLRFDRCCRRVCLVDTV
jgi:hypothetical protein